VSVKSAQPVDRRASARSRSASTVHGRWTWACFRLNWPRAVGQSVLSSHTRRPGGSSRTRGSNTSRSRRS